jgi:hypothetical protein
VLRVGTGLTGMVLLLCGSAVLCFGLGEGAAQPVAGNRLSPDWLRPTLVGAALVLTAGGLVWLVAQGQAALTRRRSFVDGATRMLVRAASRQLVADVRKLPGVQGVRARFTGTAARPRLVMTVVCAADAELAALYTALGHGPAERFRAFTGMPELPIAIRFKIVYRTARQLR